MGSNTRIKPRDYQEAAHQATWSFLHTQLDKNPLVVEPTGTGKSLQMAMLIFHLFTAYPKTRLMMVTHVKELIRGNYQELLNIWPAAPAGIYSAGLGEKDHRAPITFAGIQSVYDKGPLFKHIDFILVDEAHTISDNENASYSKLITALRATNPRLVVIGYTATPYRMKGGHLLNGNMFDKVCFDLSAGEAFVWLLQQGYLSRPVPKHPGFQLDSDSIGLQAGDFDNRQTSQALRDQGILERAVDTIIAHGVHQNRKAWLHFCQSIEDAELVAEMFTVKGYPHEAVHSKRKDRDEVLAAFQRGDLQGVTNKDILTTGYNQKNIDLLGILRLTRSTGLWVQMVGRGTRPVYAPGFNLDTAEGRLGAIAAGPKPSCLVLDFVGNTERLGPINYPRLPARRGTGAGGDMTRLCPQCSTYSHISCKVCVECGYVFPPPARLKDTASEAPLTLDLSAMPTPPPKEYAVAGVHRMTLMRHTGKNGKPDTLRVDYYSGASRYSTWLGFEHPAGAFPHRQAETWWRLHKGDGSQAPGSIDDVVALADQLRKPYWIKVEVSGKYPQIEAYDFIGTRFEVPPELGGPQLQFPGPDPLASKPDTPSTGYENAGYLDDIPF